MAVVLSSLSLAVVTCGDGCAEKEDGDVSPASSVSAKELTAGAAESPTAPRGARGGAAGVFGWLVHGQESHSDPWGASQPRAVHDAGSPQLLRAPQDSQGTERCFGDSDSEALCGELSLWLLPRWEKSHTPYLGLKCAIFNKVPNSPMLNTPIYVGCSQSNVNQLFVC